MNAQTLERYLACALVCGCVALLSGCNRSTESNTAAGSTTAAPAVSKAEDGTSRALTRVEGLPAHNLERIQKVDAPYGQPSVTVSSGSDAELAGWAVDAPAQKEAGGVDIVVDG